MKAAPEKSWFFLTHVKILGHISADNKTSRILRGNTTMRVKLRIDAILKFEIPSKKKKNQEILEILNFLSKFVYKMQYYLI